MSSSTTWRRTRRKRVQAFLAAHPQVHLHFTPTYASWLNQVELWFGKIERDLLARGIFTSLPDLARKIRRYITQYNKDPKPIRWTYPNPTRRITTDSAVTVHRYRCRVRRTLRDGGGQALSPGGRLRQQSAAAARLTRSAARPE